MTEVCNDDFMTLGINCSPVKPATGHKYYFIVF